MYPLKFHPIVKDKIWGGHKLRALYGKPVPENVRIGEAYAIKRSENFAAWTNYLGNSVGTYGMGRALVSLYERDVDYSRANEVVTATFSRVRDLVTTVAGATRPMASYEDASDLAA